MGIDREDTLVLCDPMKSSYDLSSLRWRLEDATMLTNPINIFTLTERLLSQMSTVLRCISGGNMETIISINIILYGKL